MTVRPWFFPFPLAAPTAAACPSPQIRQSAHQALSKDLSRLMRYLWNADSTGPTRIYFPVCPPWPQRSHLIRKAALFGKLTPHSVSHKSSGLRRLTPTATTTPQSSIFSLPMSQWTYRVSFSFVRLTKLTIYFVTLRIRVCPHSISTIFVSSLAADCRFS